MSLSDSMRSSHQQDNTFPIAQSFLSLSDEEQPQGRNVSLAQWHLEISKELDTSSWPKTILIRFKGRSGDLHVESTYFQIELRSSDLQALVHALCSEQILDEAEEISIHWTDSHKRLSGKVDPSFLTEVPHLQDFVVDITWTSDNHLTITLER